MVCICDYTIIKYSSFTFIVSLLQYNNPEWHNKYFAVKYVPIHLRYLCIYHARYLAHDVEEDEEEIKYEIFPWILGENWRHKYSGFLKMRDLLLRRIDYMALVSRRCCHEVRFFFMNTRNCFVSVRRIHMHPLPLQSLTYNDNMIDHHVLQERKERDACIHWCWTCLS